MSVKSITGVLVAACFLFLSAAIVGAHVIPSDGWRLHIDAKLHTVGDPDMIVHHYCKSGLAGGFTQCQLYDSDKQDARLIGVEVVVDKATYDTFSAEEKELWHHHKEEIPKASATLPDLAPEKAAEVAKSLEPTYGKIYLIWDTSVDSLPIGQPKAFADSTRVKN